MTGGFVWYPRLLQLRGRGLDMGRGAVCTVFTDPSGNRGWGDSLGDACIQGVWSKTEAREGVNRKELWVLRRPMDQWNSQMSGLLVLAQKDKSTAVAYANYGAGLSPRLTMLARDIKGLVAPLECPAVALRIAGGRNTVADALPRFTAREQGGCQDTNREMRRK